MRRTLTVVAIVTILAGCQVTQDQKPLPPLKVDGAALSYKDVIVRARILATNANEAFYVDQWAEVEKAAASLEETAGYLPRSIEIPVSRKASLDTRSDVLVKEAQALRAAAKAKDEQKATAAMQKINLLVRELRPE